MRIATWNLQHGGGRRIGGIIEALRSLSADVRVLSEFRNNPPGEILRGELEAMGFSFQAAPQADARTNTVLVAAREPFEAVTFPGQMADPELGDFCTSVLLARFPDLNVFGLYLPGEERKRPVFDFLLNLPAEYLGSEPVIGIAVGLRLDEISHGGGNAAIPGIVLPRLFSCIASSA